MAIESEPKIQQHSVAQWAATVFIVLVPIHVVYVDVGFSFKPWFAPLLVGLVAAAIPVLRAALSLPRAMQVGIFLMGLGGALGVLASNQRLSALRHLIAVGLAIAVMLLLIAVKRIPYMGEALRVGALLMAATVIVEALLVMPRLIDIETLQGEGRFVGELAEVAYGDIFLVTGTHGDSNFSALYAATWLFLILAYPAQRWFTRRWDGVIVSLLVLQLVLSLSKTGLLSVVIAIGATLVAYRLVRSWRGARPAVVAGLIAFVSVSAVLLITDATDGHHDIAHGLRKRGGQVLQEADQAVGLATGGKVNADSRAAIWRRYARDFLDNPLTGTGLGTPSAGDPYGHNAALEAAAGSGVLGLAGWLTVWLVVGRKLRRLLLARPEALALVGAAGVVFMASLFLSTNYEPIVAVVFALVLTPHLAESGAA